MSTYATIIPSGLTNGAPELITGTNNAGRQEVHTAHATLHEELFLDVFNVSAAAKELTVTLDGTDLIVVSIPSKVGPVRILDGYRLTGGKIIAVYAPDATSLVMAANVNRITP